MDDAAGERSMVPVPERHQSAGAVASGAVVGHWRETRGMVDALAFNPSAPLLAVSRREAIRLWHLA